MSDFKKLLFLVTQKPGDQARLIALVFAMTLAAALEALGIGLVMPFVVLLEHPERIQHTTLFHKFFTAYSTQKILIVFGCALILLFIVKNIYLAWVYQWQSRFMSTHLAATTQTLLRKYMYAPYTFHLHRNSTELVRIATVDVHAVFNNAISAAFILAIEGLTCGVVIGLLIAIEPFVMLAVGSGLALIGFLFQRIFRVKYQTLGQIFRREQSALTQWATQGLGGFKEARVRGCESFFIDACTKSSNGYARVLAAFRVLAVLPRYVFETIGVIGLVLVTLVILMRDGHAEKVIPIVSVLALSLVRLMPSASRMLASIGELRYHRASVDAMYDDLKTIKESSEYLHLNSKSQLTSALSFQHEVRFSDVTYTYPEATKPSLEQISFTLQKGESVALVGASGAGKTTLADVFIGLLQPSSGSIHIDSVEQNDSQQIKSWQRKIGYIPQHVFLCDDTIAHNVAFGVPEAQINEEQVLKSLSYAKLDDFVMSLPKGLHSRVGERGVRLSGGQRQRIGIARALYFEPEILVLDEATSALDGITEKEIVEAIELLRVDRTMLVIAHRLSTVRNCNRLIFMENGRILQIGSWNELLESNASFRNVVESQMQ